MDDELREILRRAERHPDRSCALRRTAFERILQLAHSDNSALKRLATQKIKDYFIDFPDLKERAINTIYDLCEDPDQNIRICGYTAITSVSRVDKSWMVQNADVLVQLLQNDDEREVTVVKKALQEHIDIDPSGTLRVLCDQCANDGGRSGGETSMAIDVDEDELVLRKKLRMLVLRFFADKYNVCIAGVVRTAVVEDVLFNGLMKAIPQASSEELHLIVNDVLLNLPSLSSNVDKSNSLLDSIALFASKSFQTDTSGSTPSSRSTLPTTLPALELALSISTAPSGDSKAVRAPPERLLRIFLPPTARIPLSASGGQLESTAEERLALIVTRAWQACNEALQGAEIVRKRQIGALREEMAKEAGYFLEVLSRTKSLDNFQGLLSVLKAVQAHTTSNQASSTTLIQSLTSALKTTIETISVVPPSASSKQQKPLFDPKMDTAVVRMEVGQLCRALLQAGAPRPTMLETNAAPVSGSISDSRAAATTIRKAMDGPSTENGTKPKSHVTINRPTTSILTSTSVPAVTSAIKASTSAKRKLGDTDASVDVQRRSSMVHAPTLAQRLNGALSTSTRATRLDTSGSTQIANSSTMVSIFGAAARLGGGGTQTEKPSSIIPMDVDSGLSPRSSKRARKEIARAAESRSSSTPTNLLARLSGDGGNGGMAQPSHLARPRSSQNDLPDRQSTESSTPSLLNRLRNSMNPSSANSGSSESGEQGARLRRAASASKLAIASRIKGVASTGSTRGSLTEPSITGASASSSADADGLESDGLQIKGAATRLGGMGLKDRLV